MNKKLTIGVVAGLALALAGCTPATDPDECTSVPEGLIEQIAYAGTPAPLQIDQYAGWTSRSGNLWVAARLQHDGQTETAVWITHGNGTQIFAADKLTQYLAAWPMLDDKNRFGSDDYQKAVGCL